MPNQTWPGDDDEDYEQSCMEPDHPVGEGDDKPGRPAFLACNYTVRRVDIISDYLEQVVRAC